jgi:hypothetical protein
MLHFTPHNSNGLSSSCDFQQYSDHKRTVERGNQQECINYVILHTSLGLILALLQTVTLPVLRLGCTRNKLEISDTEVIKFPICQAGVVLTLDSFITEVTGSNLRKGRLCQVLDDFLQYLQENCRNDI